MVSKKLATSVLSLSAAALLAIGTATVATAAPDRDTTSTPSVTKHTVTDNAAGYWTADRMRSAIPADVLAAKALNRGVKSDVTAVAKGAPTTIDRKAKPVSPTAASETPVKHIGKVFFTLGGGNYVCSGNAVVSTNESTVSTAGHCVNEGPGAFATNWTFVPAYDNGAAPYGQWTARALVAPTQWSSSGDMQYDTAFAVMNTLNGQTLTDVVGGSAVAFNQARGLTYKSFGYPAASPFNGQTLKSCTGTATNDTINPQFNSQGIPCNMTGGSSGGPWFIGTSSSGTQNSVNSYGYGSRSTTMYGPYWGTVIQNSYTSAAAS